MTFIFNNFNNLINILFSQMVCFCFNHYSDYRFCSTFSYKNTSIITKCDEAQYSPAASAQMSEVYAEGVDIISRIEAVIKR